MDEKIEIFDEKAPEILLDLAKYVELELLKRRQSGKTPFVDEDTAKQIGIDVATKISQEWGGEIIYIPRSLILMLSERDRKIYKEFNGYNHRELARKYNVSMAWIYKIVKKITKEEIAKRQFDMFVER